MANKKGDTTRIQAVPDVNKCTNLGCYSMKEREAYAVKTRKDQMLIFQIFKNRILKHLR